jgi:hypothetical protein
MPVTAKVLIIYLPWEFESIPSEWVEPLNSVATAVWVPAEYVRQGFIKSGVRADKVGAMPSCLRMACSCMGKWHPMSNFSCCLQMQIYVIPHGVDQLTVCPAVTPARLSPEIDAILPSFQKHRNSFVFLYESGALWRKGVDLLVDAYLQGFTANDDVLLILHMHYGDPEVFDHVMVSIRFEGRQSLTLWDATCISMYGITPAGKSR